MSIIDMREAEATLSRLVETVESGAEREIIIARDGKPTVRLVPLEAKRDKSRRLGIAAGKYRTVTREEFDAPNEEMAAYGDCILLV